MDNSGNSYYYKLFYKGEFITGGFRDTGFFVYPDLETILLSDGFNILWNDSNGFIYGLEHQDKEKIKQLEIRRYNGSNVFV